MAGADCGVVVVYQQSVGAVENVGDPLHIGALVAQPAPQKPGDGRLVGMELHEVEPPPQSQIHQRDGAVGGVHRADNVEIRRQRKLAAVLKLDLLIPILQQEVQLAEHFGEVAAIDFVYDEKVARAGVFRSPLRREHERPIPKREPGTPADQRGTKAPNEILIGV